MKKILLLAVLLLAYALLGAEKRALRFEDMFSLGRLESPVISPDGRFIAFAVKTAAIAENKFQRDVYLTDGQGSFLRKLNLGKGNAFAPSFRRPELVTFIATSNGDAQLFELPLPKQGEPRQLSQVPGGIGDAQWTSTADAFLFSKEVFPDAASLAESVQREQEREQAKVQARIYSALPIRVWDSWKDGKRSHVFRYDLTTKQSQDLTPGNYDTPPIDLGGPQDYALSGDGQWFAYVKNLDKQVVISTNNDVFLRNLATGRETTISSANQGNDAGPVFFPRQPILAYLAMKRAGFEADKRDIILYDLSKKTWRNLTASFADTINEFVVAPNEKTIYFIAPRGVYQPVFALEIKTGKIVELIPAVNASALSVSANGKNLIFLAQSVRLPNEIFRWDVAGKKLLQVTNFNRRFLGNIEMNPIETFRFTGAKNETVEGILLKPPFFVADKKYPLVFLIHGGPQGSFNDEFHFRWNQNMFAAPGYVVAAINFHGSTGYGQAFTDSITGDWGGAPLEDLVLGQKYLVEHYPFIDRERIVAAGASYGGFMINWIAGHSDAFAYPFRCLISHDGIFESRSMYFSTEELWFEEWEHRGVPWESDLYEKWNPANYVSRFKIPMLVVHGENDFRVPVSQGIMLFTALQRRNIEAKLLYYPDETHFVAKPQNARLWWQTVLDWIGTHLH